MLHLAIFAIGLGIGGTVGFIAYSVVAICRRFD